MNRNINVIIVGVNYFGEMASAQRVRNLFDPLLSLDNIKISNIVLNNKISNVNNNVLLKSYSYRLFNPVSVLNFFFSSVLFCIRKYNNKEINIIYHYGYPSLEYIFFLKTAKLFGYKIVYDIVENLVFADTKNSSYRLKIKRWTSLKMLSQLYKNGSLCFGISSGLVNFLLKFSKLAIPVKLLTISVDVEKVYSYKRPDFLSEKKTKVRVFYGGSFGFKDGFEFLLAGFEKACEINPDIELVLTGKISKQMDGKIQKLISQSKFNSRINFLGCLPEIDYFDIMVNSDILCMCRVNSEYANYGFPFKLGEYLASGNSVIATRVGDVDHFLKHEENSILIKPDSAHEIFGAIILLAGDSKMRSRLGFSAKQTALKYFSSHKVSKVLLESITGLK